MAETINISKMAEKLSKELFAEFLWQRMNHANINWPCEKQDAHKVQTHPSDVVFYYDEPYTQARTYINCDLKSYAKGSITAASMRAAIESLATALSCAEVSDEFRKAYIHEHVSPDICGLLFVYNHDGEYDKDFDTIIDKIKNEDLAIPSKSKIVVFGPSDVFWLNNVHHEIAYMRGSSEIIPGRDNCKYFYPHLVRKKNVQPDKAKAATLEMLTAPWIILTYTNPKKNSQQGFVIFYRKRGESVEEFLYLIDYLMHYQVLNGINMVHIKTLDSHPNASSFFEKAKQQYAEEYSGGEEIKEILDAIEFGQMNNVRTKFSELELSRDNG